MLLSKPDGEFSSIKTAAECFSVLLASRQMENYECRAPIYLLKRPKKLKTDGFKHVFAQYSN